VAFTLGAGGKKSVAGGTTTIAVAVGDVLWTSTIGSSTTATLTVSGGGVTTWHYLSATISAPTAGASMRQAWGIVTSAGTQTVTWAATAGSLFEINLADFIPPASTVVSQDGGQVSTSGTTTPWPTNSVTPAQAGDLFMEYDVAATTANSGSTAGFVYSSTNGANQFVYHLNAPIPSAPSVTGSGGGDRYAFLLQALAAGAAANPIVSVY
jgi:hypothetical protein